MFIFTPRTSGTTLCSFITFLFVLGFAEKVCSQNRQSELKKVLTLTGKKQGVKDLAQDNGAAGIWQRLLKLQTTASVLHTQAHPDDEHADLLTYLSRGKGARTAILSLNRGESGGNILGKEFFDPLGLLRTEEFLLAASYYGLDDLYFTRLVDYGFSKRVDESYEKWGKENVLAEMVRVIRINRPLVIISRFHGSPRDGHGNHQAAGEISQLAFSIAGDPNAFPEQISKEGLRPWKALKFYRGGVRQTEHWNMAINTNESSPWLGDSYRNFALLGYSLHRSQTGGNRNESFGPFYQYYERLYSLVKSTEKENSFFEGIDTTITGIFSISGESIPPGILPLLNRIKEDISKAITTFTLPEPSKIIPHLVSGLRNTRAAIALIKEQQEALFTLLIKEQQLVDAINTTMQLHVEALAVPVGSVIVRSPFAAKPTMQFVVPGSTFKTDISFINRSSIPVENLNVALLAPADWKIETVKDTSQINQTQGLIKSFEVSVGANTKFSKPYFGRKSLQENLYELDDAAHQNLPWNEAPAKVQLTYQIEKEEISLPVPIQVRQANLPFGYDKFTLKVVPGIGVNVHPATAVVPMNTTERSVNVNIELINKYNTPVQGDLELQIPAGWTSHPKKINFSFSKAGEKNNYTIKLIPSAITNKTYQIKAIATVNGTEHSTGYEEIRYRDLDIAMFYRPAEINIKGIDVKTAPGLNIGYIMGVGDEVPAGLQQLGAKVQLLNAQTLSKEKLDVFDVIIVGTRAYAVRPDLHMYNRRLLDYAKNGGHLIVLFQTPEFIPDVMAPYPAKLPSNAEEVSEENSVVQILQPEHPVFRFPNSITSKDFENWEEQRGSKFFSEWDTAYTPLIATQDQGQSPQKGGWLMAKYGKGYYTYFAYAFHRQIPSGVTGAYRILANLISYGKIKKVK